MSQFVYFSITGTDTKKFLQGQITADINKIGDDFTPAAICNLKGRVQFGLWIMRTDDGFGIVLASDMADDFALHIKKYGAFSKIALSAATVIYPVIINDTPTFTLDVDYINTNRQTADEAYHAWQNLSIQLGNYWIVRATSGLYQPQELRLHQRGGVAYDKGCYLGQEIVARLYFKASPKAYLHRVSGTGEMPSAGSNVGKVSIINAVSANLDNADYQALVIAREEDLAQFQILPLPNALQAEVGRTH